MMKNPQPEADLSRARSGPQEVRPAMAGSAADEIFVKFTNSGLKAGQDAQWQYIGQQADPETLAVEDFTGFIVADNVVEYAHTTAPAGSEPWYVWGVDVNGASYPAGFQPCPVGGGGTDQTHKTDFYAWCRVATKADGTLLYQFSAMGSHDGTCT